MYYDISKFMCQYNLSPKDLTEILHKSKMCISMMRKRGTISLTDLELLEKWEEKINMCKKCGFYKDNCFVKDKEREKCSLFIKLKEEEFLFHYKEKILKS